jgi:hypothetical protein
MSHIHKNSRQQEAMMGPDPLLVVFSFLYMISSGLGVIPVCYIMWYVVPLSEPELYMGITGGGVVLFDVVCAMTQFVGVVCTYYEKTATLGSIFIIMGLNGSVVATILVIGQSRLRFKLGKGYMLILEKGEYRLESQVYEFTPSMPWLFCCISQQLQEGNTMAWPIWVPVLTLSWILTFVWIKASSHPEAVHILNKTTCILAVISMISVVVYRLWTEVCLTAGDAKVRSKGYRGIPNNKAGHPMGPRGPDQVPYIQSNVAQIPEDLTNIKDWEIKYPRWYTIVEQVAKVLYPVLGIFSVYVYIDILYALFIGDKCTFESWSSDDNLCQNSRIGMLIVFMAATAMIRSVMYTIAVTMKSTRWATVLALKRKGPEGIEMRSGKQLKSILDGKVVKPPPPKRSTNS